VVGGGVCAAQSAHDNGGDAIVPSRSVTNIFCSRIRSASECGA